MALLMDGMAGIHIGVGFCVARSDRVGNAKASKCGTSNSDRLPRFSFYANPKHLNSPVLGGLRTQYDLI